MIINVTTSQNWGKKTLAQNICKRPLHPIQLPNPIISSKMLLVSGFEDKSIHNIKKKLEFNSCLKSSANPMKALKIHHSKIHKLINENVLIFFFLEICHILNYILIL
jgi:hypothetical protein